MLAAVPSLPENRPELEHVAVDGADAITAFETSGLERILKTGDVLVRAGDPKLHAYRVVSGLLCSHWLDPQTGPRATGFSFAGDIVGVGGLDRHLTTISATSDSVVQCLGRSDALAFVDTDPRIGERYADQTEMELDLMRRSLAAQAQASATVRVAALLTALADMGDREGKGADIIGGDVTCGFVADQIGLAVDDLQQVLATLARQGLLEALPGGRLRIADRVRLDAIAAS